jgi:hypothetical protein
VNVINRPAVARGALVGLACLIVVTTAAALVDGQVNDFDHSAWAAVFAVTILVVYVVAGTAAARLAEEAPLTNAIVAAVGTFVLWIPMRILIWAVRGDDRGLVTGDDAILGLGHVFGQLVLAAGLGLAAGWAVGRAAARRDAAPTGGSVDPPTDG